MDLRSTYTVQGCLTQVEVVVVVRSIARSSSSSSSSSHPYIKAALTPRNPKPSALPKAEAPASARDEAAEDGLALGVEELLGLGGLNFEGFGVRVLGFRGLKS